MTNRYVIEGLLRDLVFRERDIIVIGPTWEGVREDIFTPVVDRLQGNTGTYGYKIERIYQLSGVVETRAGQTFTITAADEMSRLEGLRADVWVLYQNRTLGSRDPDDYSLAVRAHNVVRREALRNNAEIIHID